jgi:hypothetical protein
MVLPAAVVTVPPVAEKGTTGPPDFLPNPKPLLPKPSRDNKGAII